MRSVFPAIALVGVVASAPAAWAFECPTHFETTQNAIDSATAAMENVTDETRHGLVHTLIDDAKMLLESARHNHEAPAAGGYDHARAIAKADAALGYATAAEMYAER